MKSINETFSDEEFERLKNRKNKERLCWHDFIMMLAEKKEVKS